VLAVVVTALVDLPRGAGVLERRGPAEQDCLVERAAGDIDAPGANGGVSEPTRHRTSSEPIVVDEHVSRVTVLEENYFDAVHIAVGMVMRPGVLMATSARFVV